MQPRKSENRLNIKPFFRVLLVMLCMVMMQSQAAFAYNFQNPVVWDPPTNEICPDPDGDGNPNNDGLIARVIVCVKESILDATNSFMGTMSAYLNGFVGACITLAIALWGTLMATGKTSAPVKDLAVLAVKVGAVALFTNSFYGFFPLILDMMEYMLDAVTAYVSFSPSFGCVPKDPALSIGTWQRVDCVIDSLIGGIFQPFNIYLGITGFLMAALFSQSIGLFIGLLGFMVIIQLIWATIRGMYIFISAYIAFALMAIISPLFIPLILFRATFGYFEKWLRITIGFILQPIFLFTYLAMLMAAYDVIVYTGPNSLYRAIAGTNVDVPGFHLGDWLNTNGIYANSSQSGQAFNVDPKKLVKDFAIQKINTGVIGTTKNPAGMDVKLTEEITQPDEWRDPTTGLPKDIFMNRLLPSNYFLVDFPVKAIDWKALATINGYDPATQMTGYWTDLMLSCIMAFLISYIFLLLIDLLPFIGTGVAGDVLSAPAFGTGPFAPPGDNAMSGFKDKFMGNFLGGKA